MTDKTSGGESTSETFTDEEKAQIQEKWAELETMFKDKGFHAIGLKVLAMLLEPDGVTWRSQWNPDLAASWWILMEEAKAAKTHRKAIDDQLLLAAYLHQKLNKLDLAGGLLILLNEAVIRWKLVDVEVDAHFEALVEDKSAVTGGKDRAIPGKVGEKPPPGAVRPDQLGKGPRRI